MYECESNGETPCERTGDTQKNTTKEYKEKIKEFYVGKCITCGIKLFSPVNEYDFLDVDGNWMDNIRIEAHCGVGGHNLYSRILSLEEFLYRKCF